MDPEFFNEDSIMKAMEYQVPQSQRPGKYLPMPYAVPELLDATDGDPFHDVRPMTYSFAPWLSAVANLGVRRLPFGIAVRGTKYLHNINKYQYQNGLLNFSFSGEGAIASVMINGQELHGSWQIPHNLIQNGENKVEINLQKNQTHQNLLISSTVQLISVNKGKYFLKCFGKNVAVFKNLNAKVELKNASEIPVAYALQKTGQYSYLEFVERGDFYITLR